MRRWSGALAALWLLQASPVAQAQQAVSGAALFGDCQSCHSLDPGKSGMAGPHLAGLKGRIAGAAEGFDYSPAFRAARLRGLRWDAERLKAYLADPDAVVPGGWMSPPGGLADADRAALAAFLLE